MSHKSTAINAIKGIDTGKLPYTPRFDLWFNAHRYRGPLPAEYRGCESALDIARKIDVGGHIVIADFIRPGHPDQMLDRGIGLYNLHQFPYRVKLRRVERIVESDDISTTVTYKTPKGKIQVSFVYTEEIRRAGASISIITKHAVTCGEDYAPLITA